MARTHSLLTPHFLCRVYPEDSIQRGSAFRYGMGHVLTSAEEVFSHLTEEERKLLAPHFGMATAWFRNGIFMEVGPYPLGGCSGVSPDAKPEAILTLEAVEGSPKVTYEFDVEVGRLVSALLETLRGIAARKASLQKEFEEALTHPYLAKAAMVHGEQGSLGFVNICSWEHESFVQGSPLQQLSNNSLAQDFIRDETARMRKANGSAEEWSKRIRYSTQANEGPSFTRFNFDPRVKEGAEDVMEKAKAGTRFRYFSRLPEDQTVGIPD